MCGRYTLFDSVDLALKYGLKPKPPSFVTEDNFNAAPGQFMPVTIIEKGVKILTPMKWGLVPVWAKDIKIGYRMINARDDSIFTKPMWKSLTKTHRCAIPARGFYEWKINDNGEKQPYLIQPSDEQVFWFAGLWSEWKDVEGHPLLTYTIITTEPNKEMAHIHNRMPVMLSYKEMEEWLNPDITEQKYIEKFIHPYPDGKLIMYPVSREVNKPANNNSSLLEEIEL